MRKLVSLAAMSGMRRLGLLLIRKLGWRKPKMGIAE